MGLFGPAREALFKYRSRKKLSLDGSVAGLQHARYRPGLKPAAGQAPISGGTLAPRGYMSQHPDEYDPHSGEAVSSDVVYSPYQAELPKVAPDELDAPASEARHDFEQVESDYLPMTDKLFGRAMHEAMAQSDFPDLIPFDNDEMTQDVLNGSLPVAADQFANDRVIPGELDGEDGLSPDDSCSMPGATSLDHGLQAEAAWPEPEGWSGAPELQDYDAFQMTQDLFDQQMQQVDQACQLPEPTHDELQNQNVMALEDVVDEEMQQLMNPWMMPGTGPMM